MMKLLAFLFSVVSVLLAVEGACNDQIKVQITPTIEENKIQNFTINLAVWQPINVGGGPPSGWSDGCKLGCTTAGVGFDFTSTKQLTKTCGNFIDHRFDDFETLKMRKQWYVSDFDITENGTPGVFNLTLMNIMVISENNDGKRL
jgi:hypothetical protein